MKKENTLREKSFAFAISIINLNKELISKHKEFVMSKQLLRSGTAVGALVREAEYAESKKDFIHKLAISLKEANETAYWLDLLFETDYITLSTHQKASDAIIELIKLLTSIIKTSKSNL